MKQKDLTALTDEELLQEVKKARSVAIIDAVIIGFLIGVAIFSTVRNGAGVFSFLPLIYIPIAINNKNRNTLLKKLVKERNLA